MSLKSLFEKRQKRKDLYSLKEETNSESESKEIEESVMADQKRPGGTQQSGQDRPGQQGDRSGTNPSGSPNRPSSPSQGDKDRESGDKDKSQEPEEIKPKGGGKAFFEQKVEKNEEEGEPGGRIRGLTQDDIRQSQDSAKLIPEAINLTQSLTGTPTDGNVTKDGTLNGDMSERDRMTLEEMNEELALLAGPNPTPNRIGNEFTNYERQFGAAFATLGKPYDERATIQALRNLRNQGRMEEADKNQLEEIEKRLKEKNEEKEKQEPAADQTTPSPGQRGTGSPGGGTGTSPGTVGATF